MTRISLRETYDNRSVIAQIAKVTDTAEDAAETVQQKAAEINDALTDVNAAVQAAEGAVTIANAASASAQQSAQTVAGYNNRLTSAEEEIDTLQSDLNGVTLRVTTAEGNIVTIQGQVTALQTADGQNVKINRINEYAVGLTGNQDNINGNKGFRGRLTARTSLDQSATTTGAFDTFDFVDAQGNLMFVQHLLHFDSGGSAMQFRLYSPDGQKWIALQLEASNDVCACRVYSNTGRNVQIMPSGAWQ